MSARVFVVWLRTSRRAWWRLNLIEANRDRALHCATTWHAQAVAYGQLDAATAVTETDWEGGDVAVMEARGGRTLTDRVVATYGAV